MSSQRRTLPWWYVYLVCFRGESDYSVTDRGRTHWISLSISQLAHASCGDPSRRLIVNHLSVDSYAMMVREYAVLDRTAHRDRSSLQVVTDPHTSSAFRLNVARVRSLVLGA